MKNIYSLGYHEQLALNNDLYVLRVPGGWIYCDKVYQQNTFVPYNDEFNNPFLMNKDTEDDKR